jgi:hypothetical protein
MIFYNPSITRWLNATADLRIVEPALENKAHQRRLRSRGHSARLADHPRPRR